VATTVPVPTPTPTENPFPDAMTPGSYQEWRSGKMTLKGTVTKAELVDNYEWYSESWGKWYVQQPKDKGNKYLFIFIRLVNGGPDVGRMPSSEMFDLFSDGKEYFFDPDRAATRTDSRFSKDETIPIRIGGKDIQEKDYVFICDAGYIFSGESNAVVGYLIYVVPATINLENTYLRVIFNTDSTGIWKIGGGLVQVITAVPTIAPVTTTATAAPTAPEITYAEVYRDRDYYMYYQNGKKSFSYELIHPPLRINYNLIPENVSDVKIETVGSKMIEVPVNYTHPDSWFRVTVKKAMGGEVVLEEGFGKGMDTDTQKEVLVKSPGDYTILLEGNKINATVVIMAPVA
jgi:hypothetical protein